MKSLPHNDAFQPVSLILETQAEVDAIYTLLNHARIGQAVGLPYESYKALAGKHDNENWQKLHRNLCDLIDGPREGFFRREGNGVTEFFYRVFGEEVWIWNGTNWDHSGWSGSELSQDPRFTPCTESDIPK